MGAQWFFLQSSGKTGQNGALGSSRVNHYQDIADPSLPPNPRKAVLYRPSLKHCIAVSCIKDGLLLK